jgi:hypothetical protein
VPEIVKSGCMESAEKERPPFFQNFESVKESEFHEKYM